MEELKPLSLSEARVILLYCTKREAQEILAAASHYNMTSKNYMWIVTQSVLGRGAGYAPGEFPSGMLGIEIVQIGYRVGNTDHHLHRSIYPTGVHFNTTHEKLLEEIERAVTVFGHGLELLTNENNIINLNSNLNCNSSKNVKWQTGELFSR